MRCITTLCIIEEGDQVLLAMKKRGFGKGWWNGFGGKVKKDETIDNAMVRELKEESSLIAKDFRERAIIEFFFEGSVEEIEMHIYEVTKYEGAPAESEEMKPKWFSKKKIPHDLMWPADRKWLPLFFEGKDFDGKVVFGEENNTIVKFDFMARDMKE